MKLTGSKRLVQMLFSSFEALAQPAVMFFATPVLLSGIGEAHFGVWVFINSLSAFSSFANWGYVETTIVYGSKYIASNQKDAASDLYWMNLFTALFALIGVMTLATLASFSFSTMELMPGYTVDTLQFGILAGLLLFSLRIVENSALSYFKANLDYQFSSSYSFISKALGTSLQVVLLVNGYSLAEGFLAASLVSALVTLTALTHVTTRYQLQFLWSSLSRYFGTLKNHFQFSRGVWIQGVILFFHSNLDKILVGKFAGAIDLAHYSIVALIFGQVHHVLGQGFQVLVPEFSSHQKSNSKVLMGFYLKQLGILSIIFGGIASVLTYQDYAILGLWLGDRVSGIKPLMPYYLFFEFCFMINIVPYYLLLSHEKIKTINTILFGTAIALAAPVILLSQGKPLTEFIFTRGWVILASSLAFHYFAIKRGFSQKGKVNSIRRATATTAEALSRDFDQDHFDETSTSLVPGIPIRSQPETPSEAVSRTLR